MLLLIPPSISYDRPEPIFASVILAFAFSIVDTYRVRLPYKAENSVSMSIAFAMVLLFSPGATSWAVAIGSVLAEVYLKKPWYKALFNSSNCVLSIGLAGLAYRSLYDGSDLPLASARNVMALLLSMTVCLIVNTVTISTIIALIDRQSPWRVWLANNEGVLLQLLTLAPLGTLIAVVYSQTPHGLGLILLLLPLGAIYYSLRSYQQLHDQTRRTIETLADAVDRRDPYTLKHSLRVTEYAEKIARRLNLSLDEIETIVSAARIHDLGKMGVHDEILLKQGLLKDHEMKRMQEHPVIGANIVAQLPLYRVAKDLILHHHEHFDGTGYPDGLKGEEIPLGARIIAVADAFDAMVSDRPYRSAFSYQTAIAKLKAGKGTQFDPVIVDAFLAILEGERTPELSETRKNEETNSLHGSPMPQVIGDRQSDTQH